MTLENSIDVMLDLETMGIEAGCAILSIGACTFDLKLNFYEGISLNSCLEHNLVINRETAAWWDKQSVEARKDAFSGTSTLITGLGRFADFLHSLQAKNIYVWGNGADFDLPILKACYEKTNMKWPVKPYNGRCYRTLKNLYRDIKGPERMGIKHNALSDARTQAEHASILLQHHFTR